MKVVVLAGQTRSLSNFRGDLIKTMVDCGCEVVCCAPEKDIDDSIAKLGARFVKITYERRSSNPVADIKLLNSYKKFIRIEKPDVVFSSMIKPNIYGMMAAHANKVPHAVPMINGSGTVFNENQNFTGRLLKKIVTMMFKRAVRPCKWVVFQNQDDALLFERLGIITKSQVQIVSGSGVNMESFTVSPRPEIPTFIMLARLIRDKGIMEYMQAARMVRQKHQNVKFLLIGEFEKVRATISQQDLQPFIDDGSIIYEGATTDVRPYFAQASVVVLPSYYEGTPRSLLEALSCGLAVITTDAVGCREVIKNPQQIQGEKLKVGENGILVPIKDYKTLADAMCRLIETPELVGTMGQCGQDYCAERFDVNIINTQMIEILKIRSA